MALDTSTTGISASQGDRLIEVGVIDLTGNNITNNYFHDYYGPDVEIRSEPTTLHGYTNDFIKGMPTCAKYGKDFLDFVTGHDLVIHHASFDLEFINNEIKLAFPDEKLLHERCNIIDSLSIAKSLYPNERSTLKALKERFEIDTSIYEEYQPALYSAVETAEIYLYMMKEVTTMKGKLDFYSHILERT